MIDRRKYLAVVGAATSLGLAGCSGESGGNNSSGGNGSAGGTSGSDDANATDGKTSESTGTVATESATGATTMETDGSMKTTTAGGTEMSEAETLTPSGGGGAGNTNVTNSELVVDEGQYGTDIYMTGLVENTGNSVLRLPEARVSFYDSEDSILSSTTTSIAFLKSGTQWEVHELYFDEDKPERGEIEITSADTFQTELGIPDSLKVAEENLNTGEEPTLSIRIENTSNSAVSPSVFCVFYDDDGIALGDGLDSLDQLPAGESWQTSLEYLAYSTQDATRISDYDLYANTL
ncbi:FxLYD domain-containing protein [Halococcus sediminicola]|uniref:FxLYD domain-containing protein n=1 Tax=Halococcus sediminicola TaxID=1264579 RepID=UPI0012AB3FDF|nr:FxLYD domain-containing protein [Halococcus sediminicola]